MHIKICNLIYAMTYTIAHITDLHIPSPQKFEKGDKNIKRILGHMSWERNRKAKHLHSVLDALRKDLKESKPDYLCITGDQTNLGLDNEFDLSRKWIEQLRDELGLDDTKISVIPGNHDAYGAKFYDKIDKHWRKWIKSDNGESGFPFIRAAGPAVIIGLSSAVETLPFYANGILGTNQMDKMQELIKTVPKDKLSIVLCHHPVQNDAAVKRKALWDAKAFQQRLKQKPQIDIVLHGHTHRIHHEFLQGPDKDVVILGAGSGSYAKRAHYELIEINEKSPQDSVIKHRNFAKESGKFEDGGTVKLYKTSSPQAA